MNPAMKLFAALFALAIVAAACSSDDDTAADTSAPTDSDTAQETDTTDAVEDPAEGTSDDQAGEGTGDDEAAVAEEPMQDVSLSITAVSFESSTVTIRNDGESELPLGDLFMCNRPAYAGLPDETVAPGATFELDVSELDIRGSGGEVGLYTSSSFDSADAMVAYVQWGGEANGRATVAVEAGLIAGGEFVDNGGEDFTLE